jgi:hypothetical protein
MRKVLIAPVGGSPRNVALNPDRIGAELLIMAKSKNK